MLKTESPLQWDLAIQLAQTVASDGMPEQNVDPRDRMRLEELIGLAELQVADVTGMTITPGGRPLAIVATGLAEWARRSLEGWRPVLEQIAGALTPPTPTPTGTAEVGLERTDVTASGEADLAALLGQWTSAMAPAMIAMQVGSVVGHLAQRALGQYELPLPRRSDGELLVIPANGARFAEDWTLPPDDLALWLCTHDVATHAVLTRPHVRARLERLLVEQARGFRPDPAALEQRLGQAATDGSEALGNLGDLGNLTRILGDPGAFGEIVDTPETRRTHAELAALSAAVAGYAAWMTDTIASRSIASRSFGLPLDQEAVDRGEAFVRGVVDRGGDAELSKLWVLEAHLPTPAEVDAPGLWIERVNLPSSSDYPSSSD
jgi:putative hydrolase